MNNATKYGFYFHTSSVELFLEFKFVVLYNTSLTLLGSNIVHMNMFWQHYLKKKSMISFAYIYEHVPDSIMES